MKLLDELKPYENTGWLDDTIGKIRKRGGGILIYGAGSYGKSVAEILIKNGIAAPACFCDDNIKLLRKRQIKGADVISLKEAFIKYGEDNPVLICCSLANPVIDKMKQNCLDIGFRNIQYYRHLQFASHYETISGLSKIENELEVAYNLLEDERSKEIFKRVLTARVSGRTSLQQNLIDSCMYFDPDIVKLTKTEVFVDCGAYDGDTILTFIEKAGGKFHSAYGFEMDLGNFQSLQKAVRPFDNILAIHCGCYSYNGVVKFSSESGPTSMIDENGDAAVKVCRLDDFMKDLARPTFIKMDIEGAELAALQGAEFIIRNYKPRLAICLYHKPDDIWEIPLYIKSLCPEYKLYIRAYSDLLIDFVLYAVV
ncbi:MAG: FkbM family methyltransferase [Syntrophomonadaceae bacterium]|jgi:FkbM family methyltransferase|nr:FkbM family methyltransferase [Syntrophomonadaceae bacterium]